MHQLIYMSQATQPFSDDDLVALLRQSRQWNEEQNITGVLLYGNKQFVQVLEADVPALCDLYGKLLRDPRHQTVTRLAYGPIAVRRFAQWSMGFHTASATQLAEIQGYANPRQLKLRDPSQSPADGPLFQMIERFAHSSTNGL
ncbi:BLUF domain-containing protein [Hymenobacter terrenus]|uniref:BLUF domain-containing protein n=1 Tax=Hymenobacter terrenus TaxID=1629124 RepID=UPI00069805E7|nr:BLUF domain-containing protein [Hymenobacter terrenus]